MDVEDLLHRGFAISEKEVHAFAGDATRTERRSGGVTDAHQVGRLVRSEVGEVRGMAHRNDEEMPEIHGLDVHEDGVPLIAIDETPRESAIENFAEDAVAHCFPGACEAMSTFRHPATNAAEEQDVAIGTRSSDERARPHRPQPAKLHDSCSAAGR